MQFSGPSRNFPTKKVRENCHFGGSLKLFIGFFQRLIVKQALLYFLGFYIGLRPTFLPSATAVYQQYGKQHQNNAQDIPYFQLLRIYHKPHQSG
mgnify:CR=1 FL=1